MNLIYNFINKYKIVLIRIYYLYRIIYYYIVLLFFIVQVVRWVFPFFVLLIIFCSCNRVVLEQLPKKIMLKKLYLYLVCTLCSYKKM